MDNHLTPDELAYHRRVIAEFSAALAVRDSWINHIVQKYELVQQDMVSEDGAIVHAAKPSLAEQVQAINTSSAVLVTNG